MKVLVIGATGLTGTILVRRLLARSDEVTAFVRDEAALGEARARVRAARGDARDAASLERAVDGQDAVISAFGPRSLFGKTDLQEVFMRNLVAAMEKAKVTRLVNLSAWGAGDSRPVLTWFARLFMSAAKELFDDKDRGEVILFASSLDYVNVRPPRLTNGPEQGGVKASLTPTPKPWLPFLSREDLAAFMVAQLEDDTWVKKSPLIWR